MRLQEPEMLASMEIVLGERMGAACSTAKPPGVPLPPTHHPYGPFSVARTRHYSSIRGLSEQQQVHCRQCRVFIYRSSDFLLTIPIVSLTTKICVSAQVQATT